jgi:hypothetical protein
MQLTCEDYPYNNDDAEGLCLEGLFAPNDKVTIESSGVGAFIVYESNDKPNEYGTTSPAGTSKAGSPSTPKGGGWCRQRGSTTGRSPACSSAW